MDKVKYKPDIVPQGVANKRLERHHNYANSLIKHGKITPYTVDGDKAPWVSVKQINAIKDAKK